MFIERVAREDYPRISWLNHERFKKLFGEKMKYLGSKRRIAKHIIPIMVSEANKNGITKWVEPFVGGANLIDKVPIYFERVGYDYNEHTIKALIDIRDNLDRLPEDIDENYYQSIMGTKPDTVTSLVRFGASFGGKFEGGFARSFNNKGEPRNHWHEALRNAKRQSPLIQGINFIHSDYKELNFDNCLIYCDPPYQSTTGYATGDFNHEEFFDWCRIQAKNNIVFVSEYVTPFTEVWSMEIDTNFSSTRTRSKKAVEKLFKVEV